jgi:hypothetical protein
MPCVLVWSGKQSELAPAAIPEPLLCLVKSDAAHSRPEYSIVDRINICA